MSFKGWIDTTLGELVTFQRGHDLTVNNTSNGKYPVVGSNGVIAYHNEFTTKSPCLTVGRSGNSAGTPHFFDQDCWAHNTTIYVKKFHAVDPKFIYYHLKTLDLKQYAGGSAVPTLNRNHIHPIKVRIPGDIEEQKRISSLLSLLEGKIDLNNAINKDLEEMAQALFKRWFVDFEFPDENGEPYKSSGGEFEESELGLIPMGWRVGTFGDIAVCFDSKRIPLSKQERESREKVYPYYGAASLMDYVDDYLFDGVYVLMGEDGSVIDESGFPVLQYVWGKFWVNNHAHVLKGDSSFSEEYIYLLLKRTKVKQIVTGAVQPKINQKNMNSLKVLIPPRNVLLLFNDITNELFKLIRNNFDQGNILIKARDVLLPKLMSGEVRVTEEQEQSYYYAIIRLIYRSRKQSAILKFITEGGAPMALYTTSYTESDLEQAALEWFEELNYNKAYGPEISPEGEYPERLLYQDVILKERLREALIRINKQLPREAIEEAIRIIEVPRSPSLMINNKAFQKMITDGIDVQYRNANGDYPNVRHPSRPRRQ